MFTMVEIRQIRSKADLDQLLSKIREVITAGEIVTVSWKKTQFDVYYETFDENKNIANNQQYLILERLVNATHQYTDLHSKILITLVKYNIDQNNFTIALNYVQQLQMMNLQYPDRNHYLDILKTLKNLIGQLSGQDLQDLTKLLLAENLMSKKDLLEFYENLNPDDRNIWFQEQILIYDKHNLKIAYEVFQHYKNDHQQAQKYFCIGFNVKNNQEYDMQYMVNAFESRIRNFESNQEEIETLQFKIDANKSSGTTVLADQIQLCQRLLELKKENKCPILDTVKYYIYLSQLHKQDNKIDHAIKCIEEVIKMIKLEKLVNYHSKLLYEESLCYDNLGEYYKSENKLVESLQAFTDSLELKEESKEQNSKQLLFSKMQLAGIYSKLKNFDKSLEIFFKVLKTQQKLNCECHIIGSTQNNIASILLAQGQFLKSQQFADMALQNLGKKYQDTDEIMKKVRNLKERIESKLASQKI